MDSSPDIPQPPPKVSGKSFWITLAAPPLVAIAAMVIVVTAPLRSEITGWAIYFLLIVEAGTIPGLSFHFRDAVAKRYLGVSQVFLVCTYLLGQFIVCLGLWAGVAVIALMILRPSP